MRAMPSMSTCGQIREPRTTWAGEILSALACGQRHQNVGQGRVRAEPRIRNHLRLAAMAFGSGDTVTPDIYGKHLFTSLVLEPHSRS
jgi:hypothetical protein